MILFPFGAKPMVDGNDEDQTDPRVMFFDSADEARTVSRQSRACVAYGAEIFELGAGEDA